MTVAIDGFAVLHAVSKSSELAQSVREATDKAALNIMKVLLQAKTIDLGRLKNIHSVLGGEQFALILDYLSEAAPRSLTKKIDPHNPESKTGSASWARSHLVALASGKATPAEKAMSKKAAATKTSKRAKASEVTQETFLATSVMAKPKRSSKSRRSAGAD